MSEALLILQEVAAGGCGAVALIVERSGSAPRGVGAMLLLRPDGSCLGTVGGGSLEQQVLEALQQLQQDGQACVRSFQLLPEQDGMPCGGSLTLLLARLAPAAIPVFATAAAGLEAGRGCTLQAALTESGQACWSVESPLLTAVPCYRIPLQAAPGLLICGAGHIAQALAPMALMAGFKVTVLDDRAELLAADRFPVAVETVLVEGFQGCLECQQITLATSVLIATYGHRHDRVVLEQALASAAGYIGMVGSRRKREELFGQLRAAGVADDALSRVHCPVGLPIRAETPAEIAVSILAELIAVRRGRQ
ncbi:XdhC family protein [Trichlorobacter lovleyi]|uniref:XdhC family protein n=1 Tax=Trichlorobacter lovleyi TaxID=313985 RepID=UPI00223F8F4E|nr:XdhC/CoxI family protein [Trichlorobacter lovleyi]QOX79411.1 XdhC family protein [Trichlorobacter lovleyi]